MAGVKQRLLALDLKTDTGMKLMEKLTFNGKPIPDIINRRVLGQAAYFIKDSNRFYHKKLSDRPIYQWLKGSRLGFKKRIDKHYKGLGGHEGMIYNVAARRHRVSIYLILEKPYTKDIAIPYKNFLLQNIVSNNESGMYKASEKAIDDTFKMLGWK